eukprot:351373-Chlamydomonas_euryale.AAC.3
MAHPNTNLRTAGLNDAETNKRESDTEGLILHASYLSVACKRSSTDCVKCPCHTFAMPTEAANLYLHSCCAGEARNASKLVCRGRTPNQARSTLWHAHATTGLPTR